jgi:hypothetical protein
MSTHDADHEDAWWSRYRARSSAEAAHHARKLSAAGNSEPSVDEVTVGSTKPPTNEVK